MRGRIRGGPDEPWMEFTAEQHNFLDEPSRFFLMDARRAGLPVDVLHAYRGGRATMRVRLLSLIPLVDAGVTWASVDARTARVHYMVGGETVSATLRFDESGDLVDFVSDDRMAASADGRSFRSMRWSTPVEGYRDFGGRRRFTRGRDVWHPEDGEPWGYFEAELLELEVNGEG